MYPLDVVKTRFQLQVNGSGEQYSSMLDCVQKIIKNEGYFPQIINLADGEGFADVSRYRSAHFDGGAKTSNKICSE